MRNFFIFALIVLFPSTSFAADVYINGHLARGVTDQSFENCKVTFRGNGDVDIEIPGFKMLPVAAMGEQSKQITQAQALTNRYFVFTQTDAPGRIPYSYEIYVNGQQVKVFSSLQPSVVQEITLYLKAGANQVEIRCVFELDKSGVAEETYKIMVGRGAPKDGTLEINEVLQTFETNGADQGNKVHTFTIEAK